MVNEDTQAAWQFHNGTKHPGGHLLDPAHRFGERPQLFKQYSPTRQVPLEVNKEPLADVPALGAITGRAPEGGNEHLPELETLARLLFFSAGITKRIDYGGTVGEIAFRAAACTGALFHIELYVVCAPLPAPPGSGLEAGVYHFDVQGQALTLLRQGDFRADLVRASGQHPAVAEAPLLLVTSDVFWRNAVKYQARAYRHAFWDSGTILANTLAMAALHGLAAEVVLGFVDEQVNELLGLDTAREAALELVPVGRVSTLPAQAPALEQLALEATGVGPAEPFPAILEMHAASSLANVDQVRAWRGEPPELAQPEPVGRLFPLEPLVLEERAVDPLEHVIIRRGSSRRFRRESIAFDELSLILRAAAAGLTSDVTARPGLDLNHLYLIANAVEGLPAGAYRYRPAEEVLELLRAGEFRNEAGQLALGQALGADAAVNLYFLSPLVPVLARFGNRGYRAAQLEASISAGRIYLAAYALGLGATGLTFFDDAVSEFLDAEEMGVMFLMTVGHPARR